jgi:hypothetical protein
VRGALKHIIPTQVANNIATAGKIRKSTVGVIVL